MEQIRKYPRTRHISGSRLQPGDYGLENVPIDVLAGKHVVVEEKMDGANCGFHFDATGTPLLQSRGHYLRRGTRERQFDLFKQWIMTHATGFHDRIGDRYLIYGEWLHAKHCIYYDQLPHFFLEFDILDLETDEFLDTRQRKELLGSLPIVSVAVPRGGRSRSSLR
jgi:ATP-dependent RNA circularization protein (DNA/RNA ligase family)